MSIDGNFCDWYTPRSPLFGYMRHFMTSEFLAQGHNDSGENDAAEVDKYIEGIGGSRMTSKAQDEPGGA